MEKKIKEDNEAEEAAANEKEEAVAKANEKNLPPPDFAADAGRNFDDAREELTR